jgi:hypothetical protein
MTDIKRQLQAFLKAASAAVAEDSKDYFVSDVLNRIDAAYARTRDGSLHALHNVVATKADQVVISRADLRDSWMRVASLGRADVVRDEIGDLLGDAAPSSGVVRSSEQTSMNAGKSAIDISVDDSAKYAALFGEHVATNSIRLGMETIQAEMKDYGLDSKLTLAAQDSRFAVFAAELTDGKRTASALIPTEVRNGAVLLPSVFFGANFSEFNKENLGSWASTGSKTTVSAVGLLDKLNNLAGPAVIKAAADAWDADIGVAGGTGFDLGSLESPVLAPAELPAELSPAAKQMGGADFEQVFKEATLKCGPEKLASARQMLANQLRFANVRHDKIVVESEIDNGLRLGTHVRSASGKQYITVPVEFDGGNVLLPGFFQAGNRVCEFSDSSLQRIASESDSSFNAAASSFKSLSFSDLYKVVIKNAQFGNLAGAEEAMAVILQEHGEDLHRQAFQDMVSVIQKSATMERSDLDKYADDLAAGGSETANYVSNRVNAAMFGLLD